VCILVLIAIIYNNIITNVTLMTLTTLMTIFHSE